MTRNKEKDTNKLLPLTSDLVFKAVYGRNTEASNAALTALLNRLLEKDSDPIIWVQCENPFSYATYQGEKEIIMDIKVQLSSGQLLDLEMQVDHLDSYVNRSIYYMGKLVNESLESGDDYDKMKESIVISIVNRMLFPQYKKAFSTYYFKEDDENHKLSEITRIHFLELGKI
ncbi:MAG: Rpn family recombination-promoting nuclease/putative transposase, partial [Firmicutes bacterium]|nr:Rpn family recombination-promoting nuclease/putative transposase [Bacillota bacterium]